MWIRAKVGERTSAGSTPKARATPRTKTVLPAPKPPSKSTVAPGERSAASLAPASMVSCSEKLEKRVVLLPVVGPLEEVGHGAGEIGDDVPCHQGKLTPLGSAEVGGKSVKVDAQEDRMEDRDPLGDQPGQDAGEDIARARGGHARITRGIYPDAPLRIRDQRPVPLEDHEAGVRRGEIAADRDPVLLDFVRGDSEEASHFPRMWRQNQ